MDLILSSTQRLIRDRNTGRTYRVTVAPHELGGGLGVDPRLNALVFEDLADLCVYSCPIDSSEHLLNFSNRELRALLRAAV